MDERAFQTAYAGLNPEQKKAVDTVEGPVLVVAGPGTGKTHILTLRVANILKQTQAAADSILVLTFTESAARTVRRRLIPLIGAETAYQVSVETFHSFAEAVLGRYREFFPTYADMRLAADIETTLLWRAVLSNEQLHYLGTPKSPFHYLRDLKMLRDDLVRERISTDDYRAWIEGQIRETEGDDSLRYVKGEKKGELNAEGQKKLERFERAREASRLIDAYEALKQANHLYDFTDVLRIVVDELAANAELKATLQEQYQYILADEHQDANALQHALLDSFALDDYPNLFVVGDEKQAVFGFQGADTTHFARFIEQYPRAVVIPLTQNFRSYQQILDLAHGLIQEAPSSLGGHVELKAARGSGEAQRGAASATEIPRARLLAAPDPLAERDQVTALVKEALAEGIEPHEIAIIALRNATADLFALHLAAAGVPVLRAGEVDLESRLSVRYLLALMRAIGNPADRVSLRESLLGPWWKQGGERIALPERATFLRRTRDADLRNELARAFPDVAATIAQLQERAQAAAPIELFSLLLEESGARDYFIGTPEGLQDVPFVRSIMGLVENMQAREPGRSFSELMRTLEDAREHGLGAVSTSLTQREGDVSVITAHKAKGMEFKRVFVVGLTAREWEKGGKTPLIPSPLAVPRERAELVRLLYVALTRAKDQLVLSYAQNTNEGRETAPSELIPAGLPMIEPASELLPKLHAVVQAPKLACTLTKSYLEKDGLSPSALNEYLESPACFFAKRVLRLSEPESPALVIGNAVHAGIAAFYQTKGDAAARLDAARAATGRSLRDSLLRRDAAFEAVAQDAYARIEAFAASDLAARETVAIEKSYATERIIEGTTVVLRGKIDAILKGPEGVTLIDFKTSSQPSKAERDKWQRQIAFYDLLLRAEGGQPGAAAIVQVSDEGIKEFPVSVDAAAQADFEATLTAVLTELVTCTWRTAPSNDYDAVLQLFA